MCRKAKRNNLELLSVHFAFFWWTDFQFNPHFVNSIPVRISRFSHPDTFSERPGNERSAPDHLQVAIQSPIENHRGNCGTIMMSWRLWNGFCKASLLCIVCLKRWCQTAYSVFALKQAIRCGKKLANAEMIVPYVFCFYCTMRLGSSQVLYK